MKRSGSREQYMCRPEQHLGARPKSHTSDLVGTTCEGWLNRDSMTVLGHLIDDRMAGFEWSSGSGTVWTLLRIGRLFSIESCKPWLDSIDKHLSSVLPELRQKWTPIPALHRNARIGRVQTAERVWALQH